MTGRIKENTNLIEVRQGDSFTIDICMKKDNEAIDLTGSEVKMQCRKADDTVLWTLIGTDVDVLNGKVALVMTPTHTSIDVGDYKTDIEVTFADGTVNTIFPQDVNKIGTLRITEQVTRGS